MVAEDAPGYRPSAGRIRVRGSACPGLQLVYVGYYLPAVEQESDLRLVNAYLIKGELIAEFKGNIVILRREAALYLCVVTVGPA